VLGLVFFCCVLFFLFFVVVCGLSVGLVGFIGASMSGAVLSVWGRPVPSCLVLFRPGRPGLRAPRSGCVPGLVPGCGCMVHGVSCRRSGCVRWDVAGDRAGWSVGAVRQCAVSQERVWVRWSEDGGWDGV